MNAKAPMAPADEMDEAYGKAPAPADDKNQSVDDQEAQEMTQKAVIPLKVLMGDSTTPLKEGDSVKVTITGIHGQDAEIECCASSPDEKETPAETQSEDMSPDAELDEMGKEY